MLYYNIGIFINKYSLHHYAKVIFFLTLGNLHKNKTGFFKKFLFNKFTKCVGICLLETCKYCQCIVITNIIDN